MTVSRALAGGVKAAGLALLICELGLRLFFGERLVQREYPLAYAPDRELGYTYVPGSRGRVRVPGVDAEFSIDSAGLVQPRTKTAGRARRTIMIVGDSDASGLWLSQGAPYPELLEPALNQAGCDAHVLNASVDGANRSLERVRLAAARVEQMKPNVLALVVDVPLRTMSQMRQLYKGYVIMYPGDIRDGHVDAQRQVDYVLSLSTFRWLYAWSYTFRALCRAALRYVEDERLAYVNGHIIDSFRGAMRRRYYSLHHSMNELVRLQEKMAAYGGKLLLIDAPNGKMSELAPERGLTFVPFTFPRDPQHHHKLDGHLNAEGHARVASELLGPLLAACRTLRD